MANIKMSDIHPAGQNFSRDGTPKITRADMHGDSAGAERLRIQALKKYSNFYERYDSDREDKQKFFSGEGSDYDKLQGPDLKYSSRGYKNEAKKLLDGLERDRVYMSAEEYLAHVQILNGIINQDTTEYDKQVNELWKTKLSMGGNDAYKKALEQYRTNMRLGLGEKPTYAAVEKLLGGELDEGDREYLESLKKSPAVINAMSADEIADVRKKKNLTQPERLQNAQGDIDIINELQNYYTDAMAQRSIGRGSLGEDEEQKRRDQLSYISNKYGAEFADRVQRGEVSMLRPEDEKTILGANDYDGSIAYYDENGKAVSWADLEYNKRLSSAWASVSDPDSENYNPKGASAYAELKNLDDANEAFYWLEKHPGASYESSKDHDTYLKYIQTMNDLYGKFKIGNYRYYDEDTARGWRNERDALKAQLDDSLRKATGYGYNDYEYYNNLQESAEKNARLQEKIDSVVRSVNDIPGVGKIAGGVGSVIAAVPVSLLSGFDYLDNAIQAIGHSDAGDMSTYRPINTANDVFTNVSSGITGSQTQIYDEALAEMGVSDGWRRFWTSTYGGFASGINSLATVAGSCALFGPEAGQVVASVILSGQAASSSVQEAVQNGSTTEEALAYGFASGVAEYLGEKISIGNLVDKFLDSTIDTSGLKNFMKSLGKNLPKMLGQGAVEGSEEVFTSFMNTIADAAINGDHTQLKNAVQKYINDGMSDEDAKNAAFKDYMIDVLGQAWGGFVGGVIGGAGATVAGGAQSAVNSAKNAVGDYAAGARIQGTEAGQAAIELGLQNKSTAKLAGKASADIKDGKGIGKLREAAQRIKRAFVTGKLAAAVTNEYSDRIRNTALESLKADGIENDLEQLSAAAVQMALAENEDGVSALSLLEHDGKLGEKSVSALKNALTAISEKHEELGSIRTIVNTVFGTPSGYRETVSGGAYEAADFDSPKMNAADIKRIDKSSGKLEYITTNGERVAADSVDIGKKNRVLFNDLAEHMSVEDANTAIKYYKDSGEGVNPEKFAVEWRYFYTMGLTKTSETDALYSAPSDFGINKGGEVFRDYTESLKSFAYAQGLRERDRMIKRSGVKEHVEKKAAGVVKERKKSRSSAIRGKVDVKAFEAVGGKTKSQKAAIRFAGALSLMGYDVVFFNDAVEINGIIQTSNGAYDAKANTIFLNTEGIEGAAERRGILGQVLSHELVHSIKEWNEAGYFELEEYVRDVLKRDGRYNELIREKQEKLGLSLTEAMEEVTADGCEMLLRDSEVIERMVQESRSLAEKLRDGIKNFIAKLTQARRELYASETGRSTAEFHAAAQYLKEALEDMRELQSIYDKAFEGALKNMREGFEGAEKNTVLEIKKRGRTAAMQKDAGSREGGATSTDSISEGGENVKESSKNNVKFSKEYLDYEVNTDLTDLVEKVKRGEAKQNEYASLGVVDDRIASLIENITDIDPSGFEMVIEARQMKHILKRHGEFGEANTSMKNSQDIGRMGYVLSVPDSLNDGGKSRAYSFMKNGHNKTAPTVLYEKNIGDRIYYVVQAVPDSNARRLYVVTAFIEAIDNIKKESSQLVDAFSPGETSKNDADQLPKDSITNKTENVKESGKNNVKFSREHTAKDFSYEELIKKPDMEITVLDDRNQITPNKQGRKYLLDTAMKNAASVGYINENGNAVVHVDDSNTDVIVSKNGMTHGIDRRLNLLSPVIEKIGEVLKNSIKINELNPRTDNISRTSAYIGFAKNRKGMPYAVSFVVNEYSHEMISFDVLYSVNAKKEAAPLVGAGVPIQNTDYLTASKISIAELLDYVNRYFSDILPESVLRHFGYTSRPEGKLGESALFSKETGTKRESTTARMFREMEEIAQNDEEREVIEKLRETSRKKHSYQVRSEILSERIAEYEYLINQEQNTKDSSQYVTAVDFSRGNENFSGALQRVADVNAEYDEQIKQWKREMQQKKKELNEIKKELKTLDDTVRKYRGSGVYKALFDRYADKTVREIKENARNEIREQFKRKERRAAISGAAKMLEKMEQWAIRPQNGKYVPRSLMSGVAELLFAVDATKTDYAASAYAINSSIEKLTAEMADFQARDMDVEADRLRRRIQQLSVQLERAERMQSKAEMKLRVVQEKYKALAADEFYKNVYNDTTNGMLTNAIEMLHGKSLYNMTDSEIEFLCNTVKVVMNSVKNANEINSGTVLGGEKVDDLGKGAMKETRSIGKNMATPFAKYINLAARPETMFWRLGNFQKNSVWHKLYLMLNEGQLKYTQLKMEFEEGFSELLKNEKGLKKFLSTKEADLVDVGMKDSDGNTYKMTHSMMMSLYMHLLNEDNTRSVMFGGFSAPNIDDYYRRKVSRAFSSGGVRLMGVSKHSFELRREMSELLNDPEYQKNIAERRAALERGDMETVSQYDEKLFESEQRLNEIDRELDLEYSDGIEWARGIKATIEGLMTDYDRAWLSAAQEFFDEKSKEALNETTMMVYGFRKANVENYFPKNTDKKFLEAKFEDITRDMSLENMGMMKERVHGTQPMMFEDLIMVITRQIENVAKYCGIMPAVKDFQKVYSYRETEHDDSVQKAVSKVFGSSGWFRSGGTQYIEDLITDLTSGRRQQGGELFDKFKGNYARAVLTLNLPVALTQSASYPTAAAEIGWTALRKAFVKGGRNARLISSADVEHIAKYSPLLFERSSGYKNLQTSTASDINSMEKNIQRKLYRINNWIQAFDMATVGRLWYAAEYYIEDNTKLRRGTEEFNIETAKVFNRIIERTQPNYSVMQRPAILRNPHAVVRGLTMFATQRLQNFNILYESAAVYAKMSSDRRKGLNGVTREDLKNARFAVFHAGASQFISLIALGAVKAARDAFLHSLKKFKDDEEDDYTKTSVSLGIIDTILDIALGNLLGGSELYSVFKAAFNFDSYFSINLPQLETLEALCDTIINLTAKTIGNILKGEKADVSFSDFHKAIKEWAKAFGYPLKNLEDLVTGVYSQIKNIAVGSFDSDYDFEDMVADIKAGNTFKYSQKGSVKLYRAVTRGDEERVADIKSLYKTEDEFKTAVKTSLKDCDDRIYDAAQRRLSGDSKQYEGICDQIAEDGFDKQLVVEAVNSVKNSFISKCNDAREAKRLDDKKEYEDIMSKIVKMGFGRHFAESYIAEMPDVEEEPEEDSGIFQTYGSADVYTNFEDGDINEALYCFNSIFETKIEQNRAKGKDREQSVKDAKSSMRSMITSLYKSSYLKGDSAEKNRIREILFSIEIDGKALYSEADLSKWEKEDRKKKLS